MSYKEIGDMFKYAVGLEEPKSLIEQRVYTPIGKYCSPKRQSLCESSSIIEFSKKNKRYLSTKQ